jgi:hypothetical protein
MVKRIVLAFAVLAGLSGAIVASAGLMSQPAAACEYKGA